MINIYSQSGQVTYGIIYYTVDTENEKNSLPTKDKMGSKCYVIESETWYILNGNGEWVPFVGEDSTADAILISIKNMSAEQKDQLKEELDIEGGGGEVTPASIVTATGLMSQAEAAQTLGNLGAAPEKIVVSVTYDYQNDEFTADKTFAEIIAAYESGKTLEVVYEGSVYNLNYINETSAFFARLEVANARDAYLAQLFVDESDYWEIAQFSSAPAERVAIVTGSDVTITPAANTIYNCGELTSLTISNPPATGKYSIIFYSGATATTTVGIENFVAEANKRYKITVEDNYATYDSWPYTPV